MEEIKMRMERNERADHDPYLRWMAEELTKYLQRLNIKVRYIHSPRSIPWNG